MAEKKSYYASTEEESTPYMDRPEPFIYLDEDENYEINAKAANYLRRVEKPMIICSIVGMYRGGKSYFMNKIAKRDNGFPIGNTIMAMTKGIWMWIVPHPKDPEKALILLDTEGMGDTEKGDERHDMTMFVLCTLLSTHLMYHSTGVIDEDAIRKLQFVSELTNHLKIKKGKRQLDEYDDDDGDDNNFSMLFPNFIWLIRDFTLNKVIDGKDVTDDEYLENCLKLKSKSSKRDMAYNQNRQALRNYFPNRRCFTFASPVENQQDLKRLQDIPEAELNKNFLKQLEEFCDYLYCEDYVKIVGSGQAISGSMLLGLVKPYIEDLNSVGVACFQSAFEQMSAIENGKAVDGSLEFYEKEMTDAIGEMPIPKLEVARLHQKVCPQANAMFLSKAVFSTSGSHSNDLKGKIEESYQKLMTQNKTASIEKCSKKLKSLYEPVQKMIVDKEFVAPGCSEIYSKKIKELENKFFKEPHLGDEALEEFLNFKARIKSDSDQILATDQNLTNAEKEKEKLRQEKEAQANRIRLEELENRRLKEESKAKERSHKEVLEKQKERFDEEKKKILVELDRRYESHRLEVQKLSDQNAEQARLMEEKLKEIEELKTGVINSDSQLDPFSTIFLNLARFIPSLIQGFTKALR